MITEIILENSRLDIYEDIGLELNLAIDDIKDFSSRNTTYSKTIIVPGNANNNKIFGHIYSLNSANNFGIPNDNPSVGYNFDPSKQTNAKIFVNKIQVFKGVLRLLEIKIKDGQIEYECAVFGELGGFASAIANKTLQDQEFSNYFQQYNQVWNDTNIINSWDSSGTGVVYPLIDYGLCKHPATGSGNNYHMDAFRPAFFVHEMLKKIIDFSGYTYSSDFFNTTFFRSLIIPNNFANLEQVVSNLLNAQSTNQTIVGTDKLLTFNSWTLNQFTIASNSIFTFTGTTGTIGSFNIYAYGIYKSSGQISVRVLQNDNIIASQTLGASPSNFFTNYSINLNVNATLTNLDQIKIQIVNVSGGGTEYTFVTNYFDFDFNSQSLIPLEATFGANLIMPNLLPKGILQKDLFISICRMFNLYVYEDKSKDKHINIEPFIDFYQIGGGFIKINDFGDLVLHGEPGDSSGLVLLEDTVSNAIDWSNKVDYSQNISIKPMSELNARFYDFQYTEDDDYYNEAYNKKYSESYGDRKEDTGFEFLNDRTNIDIIFSPSVLVKRFGDDKLAASILDKSDQVEERRDSNIRIMQFNKITGVNTWRLKEPSAQGTGNVGPELNAYGFAGHLNHPTAPTIDINFGVPKELLFSLSTQYPSSNLFTAFWGDYLAEIIAKDSKLLTCYLYLDLQDIYSLDFARLILIDGALWRLNKVKDFNPSVPKTTQVELLRVMELTYE